MSVDRLQFERAPGPTEVYEVYSEHASLGLVWLKDGTWCADRHSMMSPEVTEVSREAAGQRLLELHRRSGVPRR